MMADSDQSDKGVLLARAETCLAQGLYQTAQDIALDWLNRVPGDAEARLILCHAWTRLGKLDNVKQLLREVDDAIFSLSLIYARMGDICQSAGLHREAITFYRKFLDLNPDSSLTSEVTVKLNALLLSDGEMIPSEEDESSTHTVPDLQTITMAELYVKQGYEDMAIEILKAILERDKTHVKALAMLKTLQAGGANAWKDPGSSPNVATMIQELNRWLDNLCRIKTHAA